jgi:hypothetical protein
MARRTRSKMPDTIYLNANNIRKIKKYVDKQGDYYYKVDLKEEVLVDKRMKNRATMMKFLRNIDECLGEIWLDTILVDIIERCNLRLLLLKEGEK